jgi:hypothetical protein
LFPCDVWKHTRNTNTRIWRGRRNRRHFDIEIKELNDGIIKRIELKF